jgi:hypothetical protein
LKSLFAIALIASVACGSESRNDWLGSIDTVGSSVVVHNPTEPLEAGDGVGLREVWRLRNPLDESGNPWEDPRRIEVSGDTAYILDRLGYKVLMVDVNTGALIGNLGGKGGGPGEFEGPIDLAVLADTVIVLDAGKRTLEFLHPGGQHLKSVNLNGIGFSIHIFEPSTLLLTYLGSDGGELARLRPDGNRETIRIADSLGATAGIASCRHYSSGGAAVFRSSCTVPYIQIFTETGVLDREIVIDREPEDRSRAELDGYIDELRSSMLAAELSPAIIQQRERRQRERMALKRIFRRVRRDASTGLLALWEQEQDEFGGGPAAVHLFSEDGVYLSLVPAVEPWVDFALDHSAITALVRDPETDLVTVARYRLDGLPF